MTSWGCRQPHETVAEFLARVPPSSTDAKLCSWIYLNAEASHRRGGPAPDTNGFQLAAAPLLQAWEARLKTQSKNVPKEEKAQFMREVYGLATQYGVVCGKWMLFPQAPDVDAKWAKVAVATAEGSLGCASKVSPAIDATSLLICVYCKDFNDRTDCERVLKNLGTLGLHPTSFKPDALTYLNLYASDLKRLKLDDVWHVHKDLLAAPLSAGAAPSISQSPPLAPPACGSSSRLPAGGAEALPPLIPQSTPAAIDFSALCREREGRRAVPSSIAPATTSIASADAVESNDGAVSGDRLAFRLLRSAALVATANDDSVTLREIIPAEGIERAVVLAMMIDWEFLRQEVPALSQLEDLTVIHDHGKLLCTQNLPPSALCYEPPVPAYGTHHSKGFLLWYRDSTTGTRSLRVVITTANLLYSDIHAKTNGVWWAVALEKSAASHCELEDDLVSYFECYNRKGQLVDAQSIREFDFSPFGGVKLIASVPGPTEHGAHYREDLFRWGHMALRGALKRHCTRPVTEATRVICQFTSLGSLDELWLTMQLADSLTGASTNIGSYAGAAPHGRRRASGDGLLQLVVPTLEQARALCACRVCSQCSRATSPTAPTCVVLPTASARYCAVSASPHSVDRFDVLPKGTARGIQYRSKPTRSKSRSFSRGSIDTAVRASLWPPVRRQCRTSRATCGELPLVSTVEHPNASTHSTR